MCECERAPVRACACVTLLSFPSFLDSTAKRFALVRLFSTILRDGFDLGLIPARALRCLHYRLHLVLCPLLPCRLFPRSSSSFSLLFPNVRRKRRCRRRVPRFRLRRLRSRRRSDASGCGRRLRSDRQWRRRCQWTRRFLVAIFDQRVIVYAEAITHSAADSRWRRNKENLFDE